MEIHAELKTKSKMFCGCINGYELRDRPNENICPVCLGHPGMLPVINRQAIEWTILVGLALDCQIAKFTKFDRKNYFYPDLPKGYQISQYDQPLSHDGKLKVGKKEIGIIRIHLEEDTGKLLHAADGTLVDLSRAGTPLIELVTGPSIESAKEAKEFCQLYQQILRYLEVSAADMEKGQMRCEANVSVQAEGKFAIEGNEIRPLIDYQLNPKVELKNINSFRALERAIDYEIKRQTKALQSGDKLVQETRGWDEAKQATFTQRVKETAADYRYFPEPDLPPLDISADLISQLRSTLPELPQAKLERFVKQFQFDPATAMIIINDKNLAAYAENVISETIEWLDSLPEVEGTAEEILAREGKKISKFVGNWLVNRLFKFLNEQGGGITDCRITPENFAQFIALVYNNKVNNLTAQQILEEMFNTGKDPQTIMDEKQLSQIDNSLELEKIIAEMIAANPKAVADYQAGKENSLKFLIGRIMAQTKGQANPQLALSLLRQKLDEIKK